MTFTDELRKARASRTTILHKFMTNYNPRSGRIYAFVEGTVDKSFYRPHLERNSPDSANNIYIYNCEGKAKVFAAYQDIVARYPNCVRTIFLVDKDVDDILGKQGPSDPRIFTTNVYSIENYVVTSDSLNRYLQDNLKIRRVEVDLSVIVRQFDSQIREFYKLARPIMAWIIAMRRAGERVILNDVDLGMLFIIDDGRIVRRKNRNTIAYLNRVTQTSSSLDWRVIRATCKELDRLDPKTYVRGKFEAWWFTAFIDKSCEALQTIVSEGGGSLAHMRHTGGDGLVQMLSAGIRTPQTLENFLNFHLQVAPNAPEKFDNPVLRWFRRWIA